MDAELIVKRLIEDDELDWSPDPADPDHAGPKEIEQASDAAKQHLDSLRDKCWTVSFSIDTSDEFSISENMDHFGIVPTSETWVLINNDCFTLETNLSDILRNDNTLPHAITGHNDNSAVGAMYVTFENENGVKLLKEIYDMNDPLSTTNGYINHLKGINKLYDHVSEIGARVIDITLHFDKDCMERMANDLGW